MYCTKYIQYYGDQPTPSSCTDFLRSFQSQWLRVDLLEISVINNNPGPLSAPLFVFSPGRMEAATICRRSRISTQHKFSVPAMQFVLHNPIIIKWVVCHNTLNKFIVIIVLCMVFP